ncbi:MAG: DUF6703 family protein [Ornithinimicrobium sp.]
MVPNHPDPAGSQPPPSEPRNGIRSRIEQASTPWVTRMSRLPAILPFLVMMVVLLTGVFVGGVIGACLLALPIAFLGWLLYLTWPHLRTAERLLRLAVLLLVLGIAVTQIIPR